LRYKIKSNKHIKKKQILFIMVGDMNLMSDEEIEFFMTWFPKKEDYEIEIQVLPDETLAEKIQRLLEIIENAQTSIKEVVDSDKLVNEVKIYRVMDLRQDMEDVANLQKDCEGHAESNNYQDDLKKARVGLINLKAYLGQVDCIEFATAIQNEFLFKVGSSEGFAPWLENAEKRVQETNIDERPKTFDEALKFEEKACLFLKEIVKGNKMLKRVQDAAEGIRANIAVQDEFSGLSERYYVLCKKADGKVKNIQVLLREWKALDDILAPTKPAEMDDLQVKLFVSFLRTYASYFS